MRIIGNLLWWLGMNTLHSCLAYYLLAINAVTFIVYGIDKYKAKKAKWRIPEVWLLHVPSSAFRLQYRHSRLVCSAYGLLVLQ